jgi:hypothetical protein
VAEIPATPPAKKCDRCGDGIGLAQIRHSPQFEAFARYLPSVRADATWCAACRATVHLIVDEVAQRVRIEAIVRRCCVCGQIKAGQIVSDGYCHKCADEAMKQIVREG